MSALCDEIIRLLADGRAHDVASLAVALGTDTRSIERCITSLPEVGLTPVRPAANLVSLPASLQLLDRRSIRQRVDNAGRLGRLEVFGTIPSTNAYLLDKTPPPIGVMDACLAEFQTHGRGRRQRTWVAPYASGICLSLGWTYDAMPPAASTLSLIVGVAVCRALGACGLDHIRLKWPNDIVANGSKLGGVLIELRRGAGKSVRIVAGVGINVSLPANARRAIDEAAKLRCIDLAEISDGRRPDRNRIAAELILAITAAVSEFDDAGFSVFKQEWLQLDITRGREVELVEGKETHVGKACGIGDNGALIVEVAGARRRFLAADVNLRLRQ